MPRFAHILASLLLPLAAAAYVLLPAALAVHEREHAAHHDDGAGDDGGVDCSLCAHLTHLAAAGDAGVGVVTFTTAAVPASADAPPPVLGVGCPVPAWPRAPPVL